MKLQTIYDNYLKEFNETGIKPYPDKLLALLLLQEKDNYEPFIPSTGPFYNRYKKEIDARIAKVIEDFKITKEEIINYIEEKDIFHEEETYEHNKIWYVFGAGFMMMQWSIIYRPNQTPEEAYQEVLCCFYEEQKKAAATYQRKRGKKDGC